LTDFDPLVDEPGVVLRPLYRPEEMRDCDLVVIPGTRATVHDLSWLRERGFDEALARRVANGGSVLGLCGGYQMLGTHIDDNVESAKGSVKGLGLLPTQTVFHRDKVLAQVTATLGDGSTVHGYEIHHGRVAVDGEAFFAEEGCTLGPVSGTLWHGLFENDQWRRAYLTEIASRAQKRFVADVSHNFATRREVRLDTLADLIDEHLDTAALMSLVGGTNTELPTMRLSRQ
jgi:adenosylcobyric acid synthase